MVPQKTSVFILTTDSSEKHQLIFSKASPRLYENQLYLWLTSVLLSGKVRKWFTAILDGWPPLALSKYSQMNE